ncbi:MFS general substrate transporter [Exidia glandulosa HHB12029]|uniref:MFS general substrate transporter n=1 Tax=Exidia glandulosa HHB12029 TaxID=1314781 RepID=A0A165LL20_EXIGL|nr:MFS general substrate transporter [Exidia glandulosa HHB12029]
MSKPASLKSGISPKEHEHDPLAQFSQHEVQRAWRKVDLHIMPVAVLLYLASYIDRANIGNARVLGLASDLKLTSGQYNWALSIFFFGYVAFETPSNVILRRVRPSKYIPPLTVVWGLICALFAVVHSPSGLLAIRFFLGLAEAGFLPGIIFWIGSWYPRRLQGRRYAVLYSSVSLTGAFGGLLATAIHALDGTHGIAGWRWIFIVEGVITAGFGIIAFFVMDDYPITASWLTDRERQIILLENEADRALLAEEPFDKKQILSAFTDWRVYLWGLVYLATYIPVYSVILSLPSVVAGLGYKGVRATLMACPPYAVGFVVVLASGYTVDKFGHRFLHYTAGISVTVVALIVLMTVEQLKARYAMFFFVMFMFVPISVIWAWLAGNVAGANKRAVATGLVFSLGNIGGAVAGQIYRLEWAPRYVQGHAVNVGCYVVALAAGAALWWSYRVDNRRRDADAADGEKASFEEDHNMLGEKLGDLGDR